MIEVKIGSQVAYIGHQPHRNNLLGECYMINGQGDSLWWAWCRSCGKVEIYKFLPLITNEHCYWCHRANVGKLRSKSLMRPMDQQHACAVFLLGGMEAVEALAQAAADELDCTGADLQEAEPEAP